MDQNAYIEKVIGICDDCSLAAKPEAVRAIVAMALDNVSAPMAATIIMLQTISISYLSTQLSEVVRAAETALICLKRLKLEFDGGVLSIEEWQDARTMFSLFIEPSTAGTRFAHSMLAKLGDVALCADFRPKSDKENQAEASITQAYKEYSSQGTSKSLLARLLRKK